MVRKGGKNRRGKTKAPVNLKVEERKRQLEEAYRSLFRENRRLAREFEAVDLEGWG